MHHRRFLRERHRRRGSRRPLPLRRGRAWPYPDPASRFQPEGVHGPSVVVDAGRIFLDRRRLARQAAGPGPLRAARRDVFTRRGRLRESSRDWRLRRNLGSPPSKSSRWPISRQPQLGLRRRCTCLPRSRYGGAGRDLRRLVDAAHAVGLAVLLDVVYNHLGPDGNYLAGSPVLLRRPVDPLGPGAQP